MSDAMHGPLQSYVDKWLAVQPQQRVALAFVDPRRYPGHIALAALEQELLAAAYGIAEPHVAAAKLHWWAEELAHAGDSGGRHPLTQVLFEDARARALPGALWQAPVQAAMAQLEDGTAADFAAQLAAAEPLHGALATLETAWWFGPAADPARARQVAVLAHLVHALRRLQDDAERDRLPLPMARLARFGLSRADLRRTGSARDEALRAQLAELSASWRSAMARPGPLGVFRQLEARNAMLLARTAARAGDPLAMLQRGRPASGFGQTLAAWQAARRWQLATG